MKFLKLSLAASVALGAVSTASFAQPLEEAIKGIDVSGYLRYRYDDDRVDTGDKNDPTKGSNARHRWRATADLKTPVVNNVSVNLGVLYNNDAQNVNHGKGQNVTNTSPSQTPPSSAFLGNGLGAGKDGEFGVSNFYVSITPDSTATTIKAGKQLLGTPWTSTAEFDRGTGIVVLNSDLPNLTLAAAAFNSWSSEDFSKNYPATDSQGKQVGNNDSSFDKPLYGLGAIYSLNTDYGLIGASLWGVLINDLIKGGAYADLSWKGSLFRAQAKYYYTALDNGDNSVAAAAFGRVVNTTKNITRGNVTAANDLFLIEAGANLQKEYGIPFDFKLGYVTNFADGTSVALNDDAVYHGAGEIWWRDSGVGFSSSALSSRRVPIGSGADLSTFYARAAYKPFDERLETSISVAVGSNKVRSGGIKGEKPITSKAVDFVEVAPKVSWKHSKNLDLYVYYAILSVDNKIKNQPDYDRARLRFNTTYKF